MTAPHDQPSAPGPLDWLLVPLDGWRRLFAVAREPAAADCECFEAVLGTHASAPNLLSAEEIANAPSLVLMLRCLDLDPDAVRLRYPEIMRKLETACIGCTERSRCDRELAADTAPASYQEFCPNASRLDALLAVQGAAPWQAARGGRAVG